jgi:hypothetical protein
MVPSYISRGKLQYNYQLQYPNYITLIRPLVVLRWSSLGGDQYSSFKFSPQ